MLALLKPLSAYLKIFIGRGYAMMLLNLSPSAWMCPLPVPSRPWEDLSLDFIAGLPPFHGNTVLLVVVDRFSKGIHLGILPASHTALTVASLFFDIVVKLHGIPQILVSDRDPLFVNRFWQ